MKKLYAIALAAFTCFAATSAPATKSTAIKAIDNTVAAVENSTVETFKVAKVAKAAAKAASVADYEGEYLWTAKSLLKNGANISETITIEVTDPTEGKATISISGFPKALECTIDVSKGTVSIPTGQDIGKDAGDVFYLKEVDAEGYLVDGPSSATAAVGTIEDKTITFPELDIWAFGNPDNEALGWWLLTYRNVFAQPKTYEGDVMPEGTWKSVGKGTFTDGWQVIKYLGVPDYAEATWEVEVEQNESNTSLYRIVNPYGIKTDSPLAEVNDDANDGNGYIVFSVEKPEYVMVYPYIYSGLEDADGAYLNYNLEGFYTIIGELPADFVIENKDKTGITEFSTYKDGKVTFQNCVFATKSDIEKAYSWMDKNGNKIAGPSYLEIDLSTSGIEDVISSDDTKAEYFNLQGMRVDTPAAGQVVIKRQGNKATKIVVK